MVDRDIKNTLKRALDSFPVLVLTGPRQSGKTTVLKHVFPDFSYVNLELPDLRFQALHDPQGFLSLYPSPVIIDEAQYAPNLFSYIQDRVDNRGEGPFILSGSQNFLLSETVGQSLAGRAAILELLPLSLREYCTATQPSSLWDWIYRGGYPGIWQEKSNVKLWFNSYVRTYLERDVRRLVNVADLGKFQLFLKLCAGMHGQLLNLAQLAQNCGISQTTATRWIALLEASYVLFRLQPYYQNYKKRLLKTSKLYFYDSGLVCHLLGVDSPSHLAMHSARGSIFEGVIVSELIKHYFSEGLRPSIYFWRDQSGLEVDLILEKGTRIIPVEIKSTQTFNASLCTALLRFLTVSGLSPEDAYVIFGGDQMFTYQNISVLPWTHVEAIHA